MNIFLIGKAFADTVTLQAINPNLPGQSGASSSIGVFIANFYTLALLFAGILAFGAIVYGGVRYAAGRGNPTSESEGRSWITNALLGLLLLVGAYIILYTINPTLVSLTVPNLPALNVASSSQGLGNLAPSQPGAGNNGTAAGCSGGTCQNLQNDGLTCKPASQQPGGVSSCSAAQGMAATLECIQQNGGAPAFTVTEAMPPTVPHESKCHNDGCCVDTVVNSGSCADVQALVNAAQACGATVANEYANCGGATYGTTEGNNVHINSAPGGGC
jgi:hypothetical protein